MPPPSRLRAKVERVIEHAPGLRTLVLAPERLAPRFLPGQFLHLAIDPYDPSQHWPESRIFSIASSPAAREHLHVTFSVAGVFTQRMLSLKAGDEVWVKLPYGEFFVETSVEAPAVLVAGGTGVTPFVSLFSAAAAPKGPMHLLYGARSPELLIYRDAVLEAAKRWPELKATLFVETGALAGARQGRLGIDDALVAAQGLGHADAAVYFLSGPPALVTYFQQGLRENDVAPERIRIDAW